MGDAYWRYNDARQQAMPPIPLKRPRSDYDIPGGHELPGYFSREDERAGYRMIGETDNIGASYDRYLRSGQIAAFGGGDSGRSLGGGLIPHIVDDMRTSGVRSFDSMAGKGQSVGFAGGKPEIPLPPDASNTLFVEGLPANCTRREVSHIFRPFVGFKEVRLVSKESRHSGGDPLVLCFVDFGTPAQAATALDALQGKMYSKTCEHCGSSLSKRTPRTSRNQNRQFFVCSKNSKLILEEFRCNFFMWADLIDANFGSSSNVQLAATTM